MKTIRLLVILPVAIIAIVLGVIAHPLAIAADWLYDASVRWAGLADLSDITKGC